MSAGPLAGLRVLSLAEQYPGPYATLILADLGADVILVERPGSGDPGRGYPPFFSALGRNKRSVTLDLKSAAGRRDFLDLARDADGVLDGFRPGVLDRLGLSHAELAEVNPKLVIVSITSFGHTGPLRDRVTHDLSVQAIAGLLADAPPGRLQPGLPPLADIGSALFATIALLAGVREAERTGAGRHFDLAMADSLVSWLTPPLAARASGARVLTIAEFPAYGVFECADGQRITLSIAHEDHFWSRLCGLVELGDLANIGVEQRARDADALWDKLAAAIRGRGAAEWARAFDEAGIPWSPVNDLDQVLAEPQFAAREMFGAWTRPDGSTEAFVRQPIRFAMASQEPRRRAPALGEHNDELLAGSGDTPPAAAV